jgi:hypothetical protein
VIFRPIPAPEATSWEVLDGRDGRLVGNFPSSWAAETFLDDLALDDPELHEHAILTEVPTEGPEPTGDYRWSDLDIERALKG